MKRWLGLAAIAIFGSACGGDELLGAWVTCENFECTEFDNDGVLFHEDGFAFPLRMEEDLPIERMTYCVDASEDAIVWTRDGDMMTLTAPGDEPETVPFSIEDDILLLQLERDDQIPFRRVNEDNRTGACAKRRPLN